MVKLTQEQEQTVKKWAKEGCGLSDIQKKLLEQFGISATYMDVRFLAIDMGLEIKEKRSAPVPQITPQGGAVTAKSENLSGVTDDGQSAGLSGSVVVSLDRVVKPGSLVSGTVRFSDGVSASWSLDQLGRLALSAGQPGYTPTQQDVQAFQQELRKALEKRGF